MTSIEWRQGKVRFIDQSKLPDEEIIVETSDYRLVAEAIRKLQIRGAPAIGVAVAFGVVLAIQEETVDLPQQMKSRFEEAASFFAATRPTAVNLFFALHRMRSVFETHEHNVFAARRSLLEEALNIQREDLDACRSIGEFGAALVQSGSTILTHCNTGSLATAGDGTAHSIILNAHRQGKVRQVYVDETRPLLQGARLTAWELMKQKIDAVLITDSTAGFLMQLGKVDLVIVGADRIAANGDVANKVGTYSLAVLSEKHHIPFIVAAPTSTIDLSTASGKEIPIEERGSHEVTHIRGMRIAPEGINVYAPAFDVTPAALVSAIVTETGVLRPPFPASIKRISAQKTQLVPGAV